MCRLEKTKGYKIRLFTTIVFGAKHTHTVHTHTHIHILRNTTTITTTQDPNIPFSFAFNNPSFSASCHVNQQQQQQQQQGAPMMITTKYNKGAKRKKERRTKVHHYMKERLKDKSWRRKMLSLLYKTLGIKTPRFTGRCAVIRLYVSCMLLAAKSKYFRAVFDEGMMERVQNANVTPPEL